MPNAPTHYELRFMGHLDQHWSTWFDGLTLTPEPDGTTTLRGTVTDQSDLHGLLTKLRDLGIPLISVTPLTGPHAGERATGQVDGEGAPRRPG